MIRRLPLLLSAAVLALLVPTAPAVADPDGGQQCAAYHNQVDYVPWQIRRLDPQRVWPITRGRGVTVAVLDSGINADHPQLAGRVLPGTDLVRGTGTADTDCNGHGSIVGGIIGAHDSDGTGFAGVAPDVTLLPIRIADDTTRFANGSPRIAQAIRYAVDHHASVINMSLTTENTPVLRSAVRYAHRHDVVMVAASGNEAGSTDGPIYPASYPDVIAVSGIDSEGRHVDSANGGSWVDLAAPGKDIIGPAATGDGYAKGTGTSFAAPFVSGTAALVRAYRPHLSADAVAHRLEATADHPAGGRNDLVGYGVVNPYRAVTTVLGATDRPTPAAAGTLPAAAPLPPRADHGTVLWLATGGAAAVLLLLVAVAVVPRGRRRHWRPGLRTAPAAAPVPRRGVEPPVVEADPAPVTAPGSRDAELSTTFTVDVNFR